MCNKYKNNVTNILRLVILRLQCVILTYQPVNKLNFSKIKDLLTDKRITMTTLSEKIGMSRGGLHTAIANKTLTIEALEKIAEVFEVPISIFFDDSPLVINQNRIRDLENEIDIFEDRIYDKMKLERIFATSMFDVADAYEEFIETLSTDQKLQLDRNVTYLRFQKLLLDSINEITFKSEMLALEIRKKNGR